VDQGGAAVSALNPELAATPDEAIERGIETILSPVVYTDGGPWAQHNFPCPVCRGRRAVLDLSQGVFAPCWECQRSGWRLTPPPATPLQRLGRRLARTLLGRR
jgi:hypothetical protein